MSLYIMTGKVDIGECKLLPGCNLTVILAKAPGGIEMLPDENCDY